MPFVHILSMTTTNGTDVPVKLIVPMLIQTNKKVFKATPIYLLVLRAQEEGNEPFWNLKKS